ncbi:hypothetical protein Hte_011652 [Hypoxylon texense]
MAFKEKLADESKAKGKGVVGKFWRLIRLLHQFHLILDRDVTAQSKVYATVSMRKEE